METRDGGALPDRQNIAGLGDRSGKSTYRTTVDLDKSVVRNGGATLDLGTVNGTYTVELNGRALPKADLVDAPAVALTGWVKAGRNVIECTWRRCSATPRTTRSSRTGSSVPSSSGRTRRRPSPRGGAERTDTTVRR